MSKTLNLQLIFFKVIISQNEHSGKMKKKNLSYKNQDESSYPANIRLDEDVMKTP